jgi:hypothetical protein
MEAQELAHNLQLEWPDFLKEYTDPRWPGTESFLIKHQTGACIFLTSSRDRKEHLCRIHFFKPSCCREWKTGLDRTECRQGLASIWGLTAGPKGEISGSPEKLIQFSNFIKKCRDGE